jgi:hypothetical protein
MAGLEVFQSYIEWSVASRALSYFTQNQREQRLSSLQVVVCSGLAFYCIDALQRDVQRAEDLEIASLRARQQTDAPRLSYTLHTLQSVTVIVWTNSLVTFAMELVSPSAGNRQGKTAAGIASSLATVLAGLVVTKTVMQVVDACAARKD